MATQNIVQESTEDDPKTLWDHMPDILRDAELLALATSQEPSLNFSDSIIYMTALGLDEDDVSLLTRHMLRSAISRPTLGTKVISRPAVHATTNDPRFDMSVHFTWQGA